MFTCFTYFSCENLLVRSKKQLLICTAENRYQMFEDVMAAFVLFVPSADKFFSSVSLPNFESFDKC